MADPYIRTKCLTEGWTDTPVRGGGTQEGPDGHVKGTGVGGVVWAHRGATQTPSATHKHCPGV